jgi:hypothetical protein
MSNNTDAEHLINFLASSEPRERACPRAPDVVPRDLAGTDAEYLANFLASSPWLAAVAREVERLRTTTADSALADEHARLTARVTDLLEANNRYLEDARTARRECNVANTTLAVLGAQFSVLLEALEFYANPDNPSNESNETTAGSAISSDLGTVAKRALQSAMGGARSVVPDEAAREALRAHVEALRLHQATSANP